MAAVQRAIAHRHDNTDTKRCTSDIAVAIIRHDVCVHCLQVLYNVVTQSSASASTIILVFAY